MAEEAWEIDGERAGLVVPGIDDELGIEDNDVEDGLLLVVL